MLPFNEKVLAYRAYMLTHRIATGSSTPPLWRLLWRMGVQVAPPHFLGFFPLIAIHGSFFGSLWGLAMYLLLWRSQGMPLSIAFGLALLAGMLFGLLQSYQVRRQARRVNLPAWQDWHAAN